jgi:hypothetical protein
VGLNDVTDSVCPSTVTVGVEVPKFCPVMDTVFVDRLTLALSITSWLVGEAGCALPNAGRKSTSIDASMGIRRVAFIFAVTLPHIPIVFATWSVARLSLEYCIFFLRLG